MTNANPEELLATRDSRKLRRQISTPVYTRQLEQFHPSKRIKINHEKIARECEEILGKL